MIRLLTLALVLSACDPGEELPDAGAVDAGPELRCLICGPNCSWSGEICEHRYERCRCSWLDAG